MLQNNRGTEASLLRLKQLVKSRYGKGVKILPIMEVLEDNLKGDSFYTGSNLHVPIFVKQNYLGTAVIDDAKDLSAEETSTLVETVKLVLEPSLYSKWLHHRENNLAEVTKVDFKPDNNLVLFNDLEEKYQDVTHNNEVSFTNLVSNLIHLHGNNEFFIKRVAYQIHEMSHRWAFLPFQDLSEVKNMQDLLNLGAVTLFVDKVENLSPEKQDLIIKYMETPRSSSEPLFVTASSLPLVELKNTAVKPELLEDIALTYFEVDRAPLRLTDLKEILEMMFFENQRT